MNRNARVWIAGFGLGLVGDHIFLFALMWTAKSLTESDAKATLVVTVGALLRAALILTGGAVTDVLGARRVALYSDFLRFTLAAVFAYLVSTHGPSITLLIVLSMAFGLIDAFFLPAVGAMPPRIVSPDALPRAQSARSVVQRVSAAAGPTLSGTLMGLYGFSGSLVACAGLFATSFAFLLVTRERSTAHHASEDAVDGKGIIAGLRYALKHPVLRPALILITISEMIVAGLSVSGVTVYGVAQGWTVRETSLALTAFAIGAIGTATLMFFWEPQGKIGGLVAWNIVLMGLALASVGWTDSLWADYASFAVAGAASGVCATLLITLFLVATDEAYVGRVMSLLMLATFGAIPVATQSVGIVSDLLNPAAAFHVFGGLLTVVGVIAVGSPRIRAFAITATATETK